MDKPYDQDEPDEVYEGVIFDAFAAFCADMDIPNDARSMRIWFNHREELVAYYSVELDKWCDLAAKVGWVDMLQMSATY